MTAIATIFTPTAITMAADSLMILGSYKNPLGTMQVQKVYYHSDLNIGISMIGEGQKSVGIRIQDLINEFFSSNTLQDIKQIVHSFSDFLVHHKHKFDTSFHICGYKAGIPYIFDLDQSHQLRPRRANQYHNGSIGYSILAELSPLTSKAFMQYPPNFSLVNDEDTIFLIKHIFDMSKKSDTSKQAEL